MATIKYNNVGIRAISACVPKKIVYNKDLEYLIPKDEIEKTINNIGVIERRVVDDDVCASDLCYKAAMKLFEDNNIDPNSIDVLLFMSQTADYRIPATAPTLQHRLGLSIDTLCLDLSLGCSGYVFALSTAYAYASMEGVNRVLLLDGETFSKIVNKRDKVDWPLYGDGATATLIEKGDFGESTFILKSDGSGKDAVIIRDGMRNKITPESCIEKEEEDGNIRSGLEVFMDGMAVFNFAMKRVPKSIKEIMEVTGSSMEDIDWLVFHQANKFMTDFFTKKLKFDANKVPYCIQKYGNTSSTSVPLTIVSELYDKLKDGDKVVMSGFGAGLSWGTAMIQIKDCQVSPIIEY
ncbi:MAG: ketoacyl-ACP synthase III [Bacteroidaceae bacterium]|nr:ketoacyl-ACP synthase III [Bacteroidaceae bacterium]